MITDHSAVLDAAVELVTKLGVTPVDNDLVKALGEQSKENEATLKTLSGVNFDRHYIDHEISYHEAVIGGIADQLVPSAKNTEHKEMLISVLPAFKTHLKHCKMIKEKL